MPEFAQNPLRDPEARLLRLRRHRRPLWRIVLASIYDFFALVREARVALGGFAVLAVINIAYLILLYDVDEAGVAPFTVLSALYETMRMMALETDLPIPPDDLFGDLLFFLVPLLGLALVLQSVLNFGRFLLDKGSRLEGWQVSLARTYRNHVIVCGLGSVAYRVILDLLEAGYGVVAIERDFSSEFVERTLALGVPVIHGDARLAEALRQARLKHARSLIACVNDDLMNIEIGLAARRRQSSRPIILRIFNEELDQNLEQTFGRNAVFSTSDLAAPTLAVAALGRSISHVMPLPNDFGQTLADPRFVGVIQLTITQKSHLIGPISRLEARYEIRTLMHLPLVAKYRLPGAGNRGQLAAGDTIVFVGPLQRLEEVRLLNAGFGLGNEHAIRIFSQVPVNDNAQAYDTVIVCGLGKIGSRIIRSLAQIQPRPRIVLIYQEDDTSPPLIEEARTLVDELIVGDGREQSVLRQATIERACTVLAATSDDLSNLQIGLAARRLAPDIDLVLRVYNDELAERLEILFGVHTTFSVAALAAPTLGAAAIVRGIDYAIEIANQLFSTITIYVQAGDDFAGRSLAELRESEQIIVLALRRAGQNQTLPGDLVLRVGDEVAILVEVSRLANLQIRMGEQQPGFVDADTKLLEELLTR